MGDSSHAGSSGSMMEKWDQGWLQIDVRDVVETACFRLLRSLYQDNV